MKTRTFAEICARQGQFPEAIEIYRALIVKSPDDHALRVRLAELERELAGLATDAALAASATSSTSSTAAEAAPESAPPLAHAPPPRPLPTDLPPRPARAKKKPAAAPTTPATDAELIARARKLERLEKLLNRIQNRRRRAHS